LKTWQVEMAFVAIVLASVAFAAGGSPVEWIGSAAVLAGFGHATISDRLAEAEAARARPMVECHWKARWYWVAKEVLWASYFVFHKSFAALVGCTVFLLYPAWRRWWRARRPISIIDG
jgi:hypothetical protein